MAMNGLSVTGRGDHADKGREHDERHDARLQQREVSRSARRLREAGSRRDGLAKSVMLLVSSLPSGPCVEASVWPDAADYAAASMALSLT